MAKDRAIVYIAWRWVCTAGTVRTRHKRARFALNTDTSPFWGRITNQRPVRFLKKVCVLLPLLGICCVSYRDFSAVRRRRKVMIQDLDGVLKVARQISSETFVIHVHARARSQIIAIILFACYIICTAPFVFAIVNLDDVNNKSSSFPKSSIYCVLWKARYFQFSISRETVSFWAPFRNLYAVIFRRRQTFRTVPKRVRCAQFRKPCLLVTKAGESEWF